MRGWLERPEHELEMLREERERERRERLEAEERDSERDGGRDATSVVTASGEPEHDPFRRA